MKKKELKNLAQKIAKAEMIIQTSDDPKAISKAEFEIMDLSGRVDTIEDMVIIDEMVQEILEKNS